MEREQRIVRPARGRLLRGARGLDLADSWATDGHRTLDTPDDSGVVMCRDREALASAFHASGSDLVIGEERDGILFTPDMSRCSRVIELWATLKALGSAGLAELVTDLHHRVVQFGEEVADIPGFAVPNDLVFNQVLVACESNELTVATLQRIQELRECWGRREGYNTKVSAFWRFARNALISLDPSVVDDPVWPGRLAWSNVAKIAPWAGGSPGGKLHRIQREMAPALLAEEIATYSPATVLVTTGRWWFEPFADELNLEVDWHSGGLEGYAEHEGRRWIIRPLRDLRRG